MHLCFRLGWCGGLAAALLVAGDTSARLRRVTMVVHSDLRTGKLVRAAVVSPRPVAPPVIAPVVVAPANPDEAKPAPDSGTTHSIDEAVERIAAQHSLPAQLIHSVIKVESNYNPGATSPKGAQGLMQLIPSTARRFGVANVFNPLENIQGGARYLRYLLDLYAGDSKLALAAYNAGEGAVARYGGVPPYRETQNYLVLVGKQLEHARQAETAKQREKETKLIESKPAGPNRIHEVVEADGTVRYVSH
jgi:hypothetical protein